LKKLLILGGADIQISAIKAAKRLGYYVITCDYSPENPGHQYSDEYFNVSTTDIDGVLSIARRLKIDGISSYASDPGAVTAAFVSEQLGIPGNPLESIRILSNKLTFRSTQRQLRLPYPNFYEVSSPQQVAKIISSTNGEYFLKPVDASGSKGITILNNVSTRDGIETIVKAFHGSLKHSRSKGAVLEEHLVKKGFLVSGDFLIQDGEILFACFGDVHFNTRVNGLVPRSISLPTTKDNNFLRKAIDDLQILVSALNIRNGVFNADVIESPSGAPVIIDVGARNGGNMFNDIIFYHSGVNLIELSLRQCIGEPIGDIVINLDRGCFAHNVIHSEADGYFDRLEMSKLIESLLIYKKLNVKSGDKIYRFVDSSFRLGLILLHFENQNQMHNILENIDSHVKVNLKAKIEFSNDI
jgi:biotin carboxylase